MYKIDFHADDYAASLNNSKRILELVKSGKLDSFSILPNMGCYEECMELLKASWDSLPKKPLISVHINLIDGFWLSSDKKDIINGSWGSYFIHSFVPGLGGKEYKDKLKEEIKRQIAKVYDVVKELKDDEGKPLGLRLDSHVHTHMIPIVFDAMLKAVEELALNDKVEYVRNSKEPLMMFFMTKGVRGTFPLINAVKNIILNILSARVDKKLAKLSMHTGSLWGLMLSGKMDHDRVELLYSKMNQRAASKDSYLEILCHPGIVLESEKRKEYGLEDLEAFFSANRDVEYNMIQSRK